MLARILQHNVSKRPSVKLDHYSLYDEPSSGCIHIKIHLQTSCLIGREPSFFCCNVKHAIKNRTRCYGNWLVPYDLQVIFSMCANFYRISSNRLGTIRVC